jgi:hypothetical protein
VPTFLAAMAAPAAKGCLVKPILAGFMAGDEPLKIRVDRPQSRAPDDWFHASGHPSRPVSDLVAYLRAPHVVPDEEIGYVGGMSVMVGTIMGDVARQILERKQIAVVPRSAACVVCGLPQPRKCREHGAVSLLTRSRGHMDAVLNFTETPTTMIPGDLSLIPGEIAARLHGYDHKTAKTMTLKDVEEMNEDSFKAKWPKYWWQAQEYMRLTGLIRYIVVVQGIGNPWTMKEFHIAFDPDAADSIERRYIEALRLAS